MNIENICMSSKTIDIAESDSYLTLTNLLCYYDDKNLNGVMLPYAGVEESAKEMAQTLVNTPVQAKYKKTKSGDDFGGHELSIDKDGNAVWGTASIGTHTEAWIENADVVTVSGENKNLPCLFAKSRIWKRNPNVVSAIKRLHSSENGLNTSWEISTAAYEYANGIKKLTNYEFIGNCLLGSTITPAYNGTSKTLSVASEIVDEELMIAEALTLDMNQNAFDINNNQEKEENVLEETNMNLSSDETEVKEEVSTTLSNEEVNETPVTEETSVSSENDAPEETSESNEDENKENSETISSTDSSETETSSLTMYDLRRKVEKACEETAGKWCYVAYLFPEEHEAWVIGDKRETEMDYLKYIYSVSNDEVSVGEPEAVTLTVAPRNINSAIAELNKEISEKDELVSIASEEITKLKNQVAELSVYKDKYDESENARIEKEKEQQKEELISSIVKSGQITREEIEASEEMTSMVESLDKKSLMAIVGERLLASISNEANVETSDVKNDIHVSTNLNSNEDDEVLSNKDKASIMRGYIKNRK